MKRVLSIIAAVTTVSAFAQTSPGINMQGSITGGVGAVSTTKAVTVSKVSMQDLNRLSGVYSNGRVSNNGDRLGVQVYANVGQLTNSLDFSGTVLSASTSTLTIDGYDNVAATNRTLEVTVASNQGTPVELYVVRDIATNDSWTLLEDPFNTKD